MALTPHGLLEQPFENAVVPHSRIFTDKQANVHR